MEVKKIADRERMMAMSKLVEKNNYEYAQFREIDGMNFIIHCNAHLSRRGKERGGVGGDTLWVENCIDLLTENEDVFYAVLDNEETFLFDHEQQYGFFLRTGYENVNGMVINNIYVKTFLPLSIGRTKLYVNDASLVSYNRENQSVSDTDPAIATTTESLNQYASSAALPDYEGETIEKVVALTAETWENLKKWAKNTNSLACWQMNIISSVIKRLNANEKPSYKQAAQVMKAYNEAVSKGFAVK